MSILKQQGTTAFIWDLTGKLAMNGMSFIVTIFLARLLIPSDFGLIAMAMVIVWIATIFTDVGLGAALIQRRRVLSVHYSSVFYFNIVIGAFLTLITYLSSQWIADFYENQALVPVLEVVSFSFFINTFSSVQNAKLRKELNYRLLAKAGFIASLLSGVIGILLAFYGVGVWSLVTQVLLQGIFYNIYIWSKSDWKPAKEFSLKALNQLWTFGFRIFLSAFLDKIFTQLDTLIIGKLFNASLLGYYNRSKSLNQMVITYSSGSLMAVLFPVLSKVKNDTLRFQNIITRSYGILVFVVFLLVGSLYLTSYEIIILLFGDKWLQSVIYFKILVLSGFGHPISALLVNILTSRGNSKAYLKLEIYKKIILGINLSIAFMWGVEGYLYGLLIATLLAVFLNIIFASKEIDLSVNDFVSPLVRQIIFAVLSVMIVQYFIDDYEFNLFSMLVLKGVAYVILYTMFNKLFKCEGFIYLLEELKPLYGKFYKRGN